MMNLWPLLTPQSWLLAATLAAVAILIVWPTVAVAMLFGVGIVLIFTGRVATRGVRGPGTWLILTVAVFGCVTQVFNQWLFPLASPIAAEPALYGVTGTQHEAGNLLANYDLSWLQGWGSGFQVDEYARWVETGFWRLQASDTRSGERYTEARTLLEVPVEAGIPYILSLLIRHTGTEFGGDLYLRTRTERSTLKTVVEELRPGLLRLTAELGSFEAPARLRALHLVGLRGDWKYLDVGFPLLLPANGGPAFVPQMGLKSKAYGLQQWLGWATILVFTGFVLSWLLRSLGRDAVAAALLAGLLIQAGIVLGTTVTGTGVRAAGTLGDPNILAHAAVVSSLAAIAISKRRRLLMVMASVLLAAMIAAASGSRAGLVGLALIVAVLFFRLPMASSVKALVATLVIGLLATLVLREPVSELIIDQNVVARTQVWRTVAALVRERPLFGVGGGNVAHFHEFLGPYLPGPQFRVYHAHSIAGAAAEYGVPFLTLLLVVFLVAIVHLYRREGTLAAAPLAVLLILNFVDLTYLNPAVYLPAWASLVVCTEKLSLTEAAVNFELHG